MSDRTANVPQTATESEQTLRRSLKEFLRSETTPGTKYCVDCGSLCKRMPAQFWLDGDDEAFSIGLPVCPQCHPELASGMTAAA